MQRVKLILSDIDDTIIPALIAHKKIGNKKSYKIHEGIPAHGKAIYHKGINPVRICQIKR